MTALLLNYIHLMAFFSHTTWVNWHQKGKLFWIIMKQKMTGGTGISWTICKSFAPHSRQITTPVPQFLQARCCSCQPTNKYAATIRVMGLSITAIHAKTNS